MRYSAFHGTEKTLKKTGRLRGKTPFPLLAGLIHNFFNGTEPEPGLNLKIFPRFTDPVNTYRSGKGKRHAAD
jgi:hypothetical protein